MRKRTYIKLNLVKTWIEKQSNKGLERYPLNKITGHILWGLIICLNAKEKHWEQYKER